MASFCLMNLMTSSLIGCDVIWPPRFLTGCKHVNHSENGFQRRPVCILLQESVFKTTCFVMWLLQPLAAQTMWYWWVKTWSWVPVYQITDGFALSTICRHPTSIWQTCSQSHIRGTSATGGLHGHQLDWQCCLAAQELEHFPNKHQEKQWRRR